MAELLKGAPVARALTEELAARCAALRERGVVPTLAIVRVGEREDDLSYERGALKRCEKVGIEARRFLPMFRRTSCWRLLGTSMPTPLFMAA